MDIQVLQDYLPMFGEAALLTVRLGLAGIAISIVIGLICSLVQYYKGKYVFRKLYDNAAWRR